MADLIIREGRPPLPREVLEFVHDAAPLVASGSAVAQVVEEWDTSGDGVLSQEEWNAGLSEMGLFSNWDADGNGSLTSEEFAGGLFVRAVR